MTKNWKAGVTTALLSLSLIGAGAALTPAAHARTTAPAMNNMRGQWHSNRNIHYVRHRLEMVIDNLQRDQHDYGGHRVAALNLLQQAREQLLQAEQYQASHPTSY